MSVRDVIQAAAGASGGSSTSLYVEDVFSTKLYTGNGTSQTITNGIDLATNGGMVWTKSRSATSNNVVFDTVRGVNAIFTDNTTGQITYDSDQGLDGYTSTGYSVGYLSSINGVGRTFVSWTFRKAPKFFDFQTKSHTTGSPSYIDLSGLSNVGMVLVKQTDASSNWYTWHRSLASGNNLALNTTSVETTTNAYLSVSGTTLTISGSAPTGNYIIYALAHNAGGFGASGTDSVVACGSYAGAYPTSVSLGWEPQFVIIKNTSYAADWVMFDNVRGVSTAGNDPALNPNLPYAETTTNNYISFTSTGFTTTSEGYTVVGGNTNWNYIYLAIRKNMKV